MTDKKMYDPPLPVPQRRRLRIFLGDPSTQRGYDNYLILPVPYEKLAPDGPYGSRLMVVDYDRALDCYYAPVNLDDPVLVQQDGLEPNENLDPRFHQQMVYAVASHILELFENALGRPIHFLYRSSDKPEAVAKRQKLRLLPHAYRIANAHFDAKTLAIYFGYFRAGDQQAGTNQPGQWIFTCLSYDIIAHEMTHALLNRLRRGFLWDDPFDESFNKERRAFHEAFADLVTVLSKFSLGPILRKVIEDNRGRLRSPQVGPASANSASNPLFDLATQVGEAMGKDHGAIRQALTTPDAKAYARFLDPATTPPGNIYDLGILLVSAVTMSLVKIYELRASQLMLMATGGSGILQDGAIEPNLLNQLSSMAADTANRLLKISIRAIEFTSPIGVTFSGYLRALLTADYLLSPDEEFHLRRILVESFAERGIFASEAGSQDPASVRFRSQTEQGTQSDSEIDAKMRSELRAMLQQTVAIYFDEQCSNSSGEKLAKAQLKLVRDQLLRFARHFARELLLSPSVDLEIFLDGFHVSFYFDQYGQLKVLFLVRYFQYRDKSKLSHRGVTLVVDTEGTLLYRIKMPIIDESLEIENDSANKGASQ